MTTNSKLTVTHVTATTPIKSVAVVNGAGYFDLVVNKNKNGKAIRIADKYGSPARVHVTLDSVDALIEALQLVKARGESQSVKDLGYAPKTAAAYNRF